MGEFVVFYSWQSGLPNNTNRGFIESALQSALKGIERDSAISVSPRLDKDTEGVSGTPDIAATILDKIRQSDCFVADISFVAKSADSGGGEYDLLPNPNVLIELGYALSELGSERIILVLNDATGGQDKLPFDLRHKRWPITYDLASATDVEDRRAAKQQLVS